MTTPKVGIAPMRKMIHTFARQAARELWLVLEQNAHRMNYAESKKAVVTGDVLLVRMLTAESYSHAALLVWEATGGGTQPCGRR